MLSIIYSTNEKPILKVLLMNKTKNNAQKIIEYAIFLCF